MTVRYDILTSMGLDQVLSEAPVPNAAYVERTSRSGARLPDVVDEEPSVEEFESREEMFEFVNLFLKMAETNFGRQTREIEKAISGWPKNEEFDPNDKLVDWLTEEESFLASFYKGLAVPPAEDAEATLMYKKLEGMCLKYLELFHNLRNKILLHDGDASPRTGRVITSGKELLDSIKDTR